MSVPEIYEPHDDGGKDYIVQVKIKNGPLLRAIRMRGYKTIVSFMHACGFSNAGQIYDYLSLKRTPLRRDRKEMTWQNAVLTMAATLRLPPESLFPEQHLDTALKRSSGEVELSYEEVQHLIGADEHVGIETAMQRTQLLDGLAHAITTLRPIEQEVLRRRFGLNDTEAQTLDEVGEATGKSRERIRQIEKKALRKLQHPSRSQQFVDCGGFGFLDNKPE